MKKSIILLAVAFAAVSSFAADFAVDNSKWKPFQWVKNGKGEIVERDKEKIMVITADPGKYIHWFLDQPVNITKDTKIKISFDYRAKLNQPERKRAYMGIAMYQHNLKGSYINRALSFKSFSFANTEFGKWQSVSVTKVFPRKSGKTEVGSGKLFFNVGNTGTVEIKNVKIELLD